MPTVAALAGVLLAACTSATDSRQPPGSPPGSCPSGRHDHEGAVATETWCAADNPHRLTGTVTVGGTLTIEAGAQVYAAVGAGFLLESGAALVARGTAAAPVLLTAADTSAGWAGIRSQGLCSGERVDVTLAHVRLEHARDTMSIRVSGGQLDIDSSLVRRSGPISLCWTSGRVFGSTLDLVPAPSAPGDGVFLTYPGAFTFERTVITGAGILCYRSIVLKLRHVRISGSRGSALSFGSGTPCSAVVDSSEFTGSTRDGVSVSVGGATTITIHHSNIHDNGGVGVRVGYGSSTVDARFNWWGDPAGPNGPAGDGVSGAVDWSGPLGAAVPLALRRLAPRP